MGWVEDRFIAFGRDHLRRWRPLPRGGNTHRFVGTELEPYVAVAFYGRHSAYFTSILSGVNVSCNAESNVLRRADNQPNPCGTRLTTDYLHRRSDKKAYPLSQDRVAMGKSALSPTKRQRIFPRRQRISHQNPPRCFPVIRYWRSAPTVHAGTVRCLPPFLLQPP